MKKRLRIVTAVICILSILTLAACSPTDTEQLKEETKEATGNIVQQFFQDIWVDARQNVDDVLQTWKESYQNTVDGLKEDFTTTDWEDVLTSQLGDETLTISRRHGVGFVAVHSTTYRITLYEGDVCTYSYVNSTTPCPKILWTLCMGGMAPLESVDHSDGTLMGDIYPYIQDIYGYVALHQQQTNNATAEDLKKAFVNGVFNGVITSQINGIKENAHSDFIGANISMVGNGLGAMLGDDNDECLSKIYELYTASDDSVESYDKTKNLEKIAATYDPVIPHYVAGLDKAFGTVHNEMIDILLFMKFYETDWQEAKSSDEFTLNYKEIELQPKGSNIQWRYKGKTKWKNIEPLDKVQLNGAEVLLRVSNSNLEWRYAISNLQLATARVQKALHEKFKEVATPVK